MANGQVSVGRIVRFVTLNGKERPATVVAVHGENVVDLNVNIHPGEDMHEALEAGAHSSVLFQEKISYDENKKPLTWAWPPRS
jgi:hypothetical protein